MEKLSFSGTVENWLSLIHSYLSSRKQTVRLEVFSVVSQGSILGPLFFLVFINDLSSCVMSATFGYADYKMFADNPLTLNLDVMRLWKWCEENCISKNLNLTKSKVLWLERAATIALPNH